ncbi:MAG: TRAP transporter small permease [Hyphomicrobiales bacterium]|nr:TRAP transporter small permease [Hyphomicrobiales bacterium]
MDPQVGPEDAIHDLAKTRLGRAVNAIEETFIAVTLGLMTLVTFANVVARYVFNDNILWALEATVFLFAWLVLLGSSYCVRTRAHLGVDLITSAVPPTARRGLAMLAIVACLAFSVFLFIGSWNYWAPFAALPTLDGTLKDQAWYEVNDIPMVGFLRFLEASMNQGEVYEKLPRFIPYAALPIGMALLTFRFLQLGWLVASGKIDSVIASHEADGTVGTGPTHTDQPD